MTEVGKLYVRQASGIVRNISPLNAMALASGCSNLAGATAFMFAYMPYLYPGADLLWSIIIAIILCIGQAGLYAIFAASMPRAGGDYIYVSRTLHPSLGFAASFAFMATMVLYSGILCWLQVGLVSSAFVLLSKMLNIPLANDFGVWMMTQNGLLIMGTAMLVVALLTVIFGIRSLRIAIMAFFVMGMIWAVVTVGVLASTNVNTFKLLLDQFTGSSGTYQSIISTASEQGFKMPSFSVYDTFGAVVLVNWGVFGYWTTSYYAGEMKELRKNAVVSMIGTLIVWGVFSALFAIFLVNAVGSDFLGSSVYLYYNHPDLFQLSVPPTLPFLEAIMSQNGLVSALIVIGFIGWGFIYFPSYFMPMSRVLFAWSWDRIAPTKFAEVSKRYSSPYVAVAVIAALFEVFLVAWIYYPQFFLVNLYFLYVPLYTMMGIAGVAFPYLKKQVYEKSALKPSLLKIPLIVICGLVTIANWILIGYFIWANPAIVGEVSGFTIGLTAGVYALAIVIYYAAVYYHRKKGLDIRYIFKEVPPA
jgi:APA family basic amino acid/polyamine antiporter